MDINAVGRRRGGVGGWLILRIMFDKLTAPPAGGCGGRRMRRMRRRGRRAGIPGRENINLFI